MPAIIFTADAGTDQLTMVGHGLLTGDGPAASRNIGGGLPSPLVGVTDYWIIRIDDDHVKLATSSSNAMAGTAINLTTNGTGTNVLEIGIPYRRPRTYAPNSQVKSADLNANFDSWLALYALLTAQPQGIWNGIQLAGSLKVGVDFDVAGMVTSDLSLAPGKKLKHGVKTKIIPVLPPEVLTSPFLSRSAVIHHTGSGAFPLHVDLPFDVGTTILAVRAHLKDNATGPATAHFTLVSATAGTYLTLHATSNTSSGSGAEQTIEATGLSVLTAPATRYTVIAECLTGTTNVLVHFLEVDYAQL